MKIKPKIYAELLLESIKDKADTKKVAANFWNLLQKNKQYRELPKILSDLEQLYAEKSGAKVAYVQSGESLSDKELGEVKNKLEKTTGKKIIVKFEQKDITGIAAKIDNQIIDLSVENKILRLRKKLNS